MVYDIDLVKFWYYFEIFRLFMYVVVLFLKIMKSGFLKMLYELVFYMYKNI